MSDIETLREQVIAAFNWDADTSTQNTQDIRFLLNTGDWVKGGLVTHNAATFTIQTSRDGHAYTRLEIPYHGICAIERVFDPE